MSKQNLRVQIDVSMYESVDMLKDPMKIDSISRKVRCAVKDEGYVASSSSAIKASSNAVSLLLSRKKQLPPSTLSVYIPMSVLKPIRDNVVPTTSSGDDDASESNSSAGDELDSDEATPSDPSVRFSLEDGTLKAEANFEYLLEYFKHSLSKSIKGMKIGKFLNAVCTFVFLDLKYAVNVRIVKNELSRQISYFVQSARNQSSSRSVIQVLRKMQTFSFSLRSVVQLHLAESSRQCREFQSDDALGPMLVIRDDGLEPGVIQFYPSSEAVEITFGMTWIEKALASLDLTGGPG